MRRLTLILFITALALAVSCKGNNSSKNISDIPVKTEKIISDTPMKTALEGSTNEPDEATQEVALQVTALRVRSDDGENWSDWLSSNAIIYIGLDDDGDFAFYYEDDENSENDFYFVITYMSDSTFDNEGGEHATARITDVESGDRGTLELYTYPSGDRSLFTIKLPYMEAQFRTKDL